MNFSSLFVGIIISFAGTGVADLHVENDLVYVRSKIASGDFSDIFNADVAVKWNNLVRSNGIIEEWVALQESLSSTLRERNPADIVTRSQYWFIVLKVYSFIFDIAAFYVSNFHESPERNNLIRKIMLFAKNPTTICGSGYNKCLRWTADVRFDNRYIEGLTLWTAIMFVVASGDPTENGYHGLFYMDEAAEAGVEFVYIMRESLRSNPSKAITFVCLLENTPFAELKINIPLIEEWLTDRRSDWLPGTTPPC